MTDLIVSMTNIISSIVSTLQCCSIHISIVSSMVSEIQQPDMAVAIDNSNSFFFFKEIG